MPYTIEKAVPTDAEALASISHANEPNPIRRLMHGTATAEERKEDLVERWSKTLEDPAQLVLVAREDVGGVVSFAEWALPRDEPPVIEPSEEERQILREKRRAHFQQGMNVPLLLEFYDKVDTLRREGFQGRKRWYLNNVGTLAPHRGQGLASKLICWPFEEADRERVAVALFTDGLGRARSIYERLGFVQTAGFVIELEAFGGEGRHEEIAMVREPKYKN